MTPEQRTGRAGTLADALDPERFLAFDAVHLFVERATAARPSFALDRSNAGAVALICTRLDGMPLAIELAAARVKLLPPDAILARLERQFELLATAARDVPERQRTLRGAIAWSYDLLDPPARHLLDRLSCFAGGCDLEIAEQVCGPSDELGMDVFDGIAELAEQSLVRQSEAGGEVRFTMPDTIRAFAAERLEARGEAEEIRRRHARAYLAPGRGRRAPAGRRRPAPLAGAPGARPRQPASRPDLGGRGARAGPGRGPRLSTLALLAEARPSLGGTPPARGCRGPPVARRRPGGSRPRPRGPRWGRLLAGRLRGRRARLPGGPPTLAEDRRSIRDRERPLQPGLHLQHGRERDRGRAGLRHEPWADRSSRRAWRSTARSATSTGSATSSGRWAAPTCSLGATRSPWRPSRRPVGPSRPAATGRWRPGRSTCSASSTSTSRTTRPPRTRSVTPSATSARPATSPARRSAVEDFATLALASGDKERGIRLWAASRRIQETLGTGLVQAQINAAGQQAWLDPEPGDATPERRAELEAEGRSMTLDEALTYALEGVLPA